MRNKIFVSLFLLIASFVFSAEAEAALLRSRPSQTEVTVGNIVTVNVTVDTLGAVINNAESVIQFPTDLLEVVSIDNLTGNDFTSSIFTLWVEQPTFSNRRGEVSFNGGVPNPGYQGGNGNIFSITFRTKKVGTASVQFTNSSVRENDGLGTDILSGTIGSEINIISSIQPPPPPVVDTGFVLTSPSHPDQNGWFSNEDVQMTWTLPENATAVRTLLGSFRDSEPTVLYDPPIKSKSVPNVDDGIWYFHVDYFADGVWSDAEHYRLQIDTTDPADLSVRSEEGEFGDTILHMKAGDSLSGISHFTVEKEGEKPIKVPADASGEASTEVQFARAGEHILTVSAFDKAGNKVSTTITVVVDQVSELIIDSYPGTIKINESIEASGTSPYPYAPLRVSIKDSDDVIQVYKIKSNSLSKFDFISQPITTEGLYTMWVDLLRDGDEIVLSSQRVEIQVRTPLLLQIGSYTIGLMKVLIPATLLLLLFLLLLMYGWWRFLILWRRTKKETDEAEQAAKMSFKVLRGGVDHHLAELKKSKRKLTKGEEAFLEEFSDKLKEAEKIVTKEIRDIKKF